MWSVFSTFCQALRGPDVDVNEIEQPTFVCDAHLSHIQRQRLASYEIRRDVPFSLSQNGLGAAESPTIPMKTLGTTELVQVNSDTVRVLRSCENGRILRVQFQYSTKSRSWVEVYYSSYEDEAKRTRQDLRVSQDCQFDNVFQLSSTGAADDPLIIRISIDGSKFTRLLEFSRFKEGDNHLTQQILSYNGIEMVIQTLYGAEEGNNSVNNQTNCVICLGDDGNTAALPCRHKCLCSDCAASLLTKGSKCPVCRSVVQLWLRLDQND
jgi:hypothetical protein